MNQQETVKILEAVQSGGLSVAEATLKLKMEPFQDLGFAKVDHHRGVRQGVCEVIYGAGKTDEQILAIADAMRERHQKTILVTRISQETADVLSKKHPLRYEPRAHVAILGELPEPDGDGVIVVATGGTSDIPVAEEAALVAEALGNRVTRLYDVGVSVAVAGMEGALPSVIGGLADCPVIAVPTSVGYGASLGGIAALLSMLNSCASGVSVVNIDNGFGGGYLASMINHLGSQPK